jgi:hypothetical protein
MSILATRGSKATVSMAIVMYISNICRYHSVRLDAVHYCEREYELAEKRKRKSFFERNGESKDPAQQRLELFASTVRENAYLGSMVLVLKMPYMIRETCKADLARAVSGLPNLRYVDLPDSLFSGDPSLVPLSQELMHRCPELRKIRYSAGSESNFKSLTRMTQWMNLEVLELNNLAVGPETLLYVLGSFPVLHEVKLAGIQTLEDSMFLLNPALPAFPALSTLVLEGPMKLSVAGILPYLSRPDTQEILTSLSFIETELPIDELYRLLSNLPRLTDLTIRQSVTRTITLAPIPPLKSVSLTTLRFEILPSSTSSTQVVDSYYAYLVTSLMSGSLPSLTTLFAYNTSLPELLLLPPVNQFAPPNITNGPMSSRFSSYSIASSTTSSSHSERYHIPPESMLSMASTLTLYTKPASAPELEWSVTVIDPPSIHNGRQGSRSATRPLSMISNSSMSAFSISSQKGNLPVVGNGFGGFLAVPEEGASRRGSLLGHSRKASKGSGTEWMGSE